MYGTQIFTASMQQSYWGEPEQAPPYNLAVRNGSMVHA